MDSIERGETFPHKGLFDCKKKVERSWTFLGKVVSMLVEIEMVLIAFWGVTVGVGRFMGRPFFHQ